MEILLLNDAVVALTFFGLFGLTGLALLALWIYCIVDVVRSEFKDKNGQIIWLLIVLLTHPVGSIIYLILRNEQKAQPMDEIL